MPSAKFASIRMPFSCQWRACGRSMRWPVSLTRSRADAPVIKPRADQRGIAEAAVDRARRIGVDQRLAGAAAFRGREVLTIPWKTVTPSPSTVLLREPLIFDEGYRKSNLKMRPSAAIGNSVEVWSPLTGVWPQPLLQQRSGRRKHQPSRRALRWPVQAPRSFFDSGCNVRAPVRDPHRPKGLGQ
jgi:hypothetical protein